MCLSMSEHMCVKFKHICHFGSQDIKRKAPAEEGRCVLKIYGNSDLNYSKGVAESRFKDTIHVYMLLLYLKISLKIT